MNYIHNVLLGIGSFFIGLGSIFVPHVGTTTIATSTPSISVVQVATTSPSLTKVKAAKQDTQDDTTLKQRQEEEQTALQAQKAALEAAQKAKDDQAASLAAEQKLSDQQAIADKAAADKKAAEEALQIQHEEDAHRRICDSEVLDMENKINAEISRRNHQFMGQYLGDISTGTSVVGNGNGAMDLARTVYLYPYVAAMVTDLQNLQATCY